MRDPSTWATEFEVMATSHLLLRPIHAITDAAEDHGCVMQFAPPEHISQDAWGGTLYLAHFLDWHFEGTAQVEPEIEALTQQKEAIQRGRSRTPPPSTSKMPLQQQTSAGDATSSNTSADDVCLVCYENARTHACIPCGHLCLCLDCVNRLWECHELPGCPVCRNLVREFQRIYPV